MAAAYEIDVVSQNSIYDRSVASNNNRKLKVHFSIPEKGVDTDTGLLLLIAGYGGYASSKIYQKMRHYFSDKYNLVTLQCDYFGYEFMQNIDKLHIPNTESGRVISSKEIARIYNRMNLGNIGRESKAAIKVYVDLSEESAANFNEMGILQALDNIVALLKVANILYDNNYQFNTKKIISYGHSHGAYLSYLCNALSPRLFSLLVDNSAWLRPVYLKQARKVSLQEGNLDIIAVYEYLASKIITDLEIFELSFLYSNFENNARVIAYQGTTDNLVDLNEKVAFCNKINGTCVTISSDQVDNIIFKSTTHGVGADFIKLFEFTMDHFNICFAKDSFLDLQNEVVFTTAKQKYTIDYRQLFPRLNIE